MVKVIVIFVIITIGAASVGSYVGGKIGDSGRGQYPYTVESDKPVYYGPDDFTSTYPSTVDEVNDVYYGPDYFEQQTGDADATGDDVDDPVLGVYSGPDFWGDGDVEADGEGAGIPGGAAGAGAADGGVSN